MIPHAGRCCDGEGGTWSHMLAAAVMGEGERGKAVQVQLYGSRGSEVGWRELTSTSPPKATLPLSLS